LKCTGETRKKKFTILLNDTTDIYGRARVTGAKEDETRAAVRGARSETSIEGHRDSHHGVVIHRINASPRAARRTSAMLKES